MSHRAHQQLAPHASAPGFARPDAQPEYAPDLGLEPVHMRLHLSPDVDARSLDADVTITVQSRTGRTSVLRLDAVDFDDLDVSGPPEHPFSSHYTGDEVVITWAKAPGLDEQRTVTLRYTVRQPLTGLVFCPRKDGDPQGAFVATDNETERARYWLACVDHPSIRPRLDIHLTVPAHMRALANGAKVDELVHDDGTRTAHWQLDFPCPSYLVCFVAGELVEWDGGAHLNTEGLVPVACFAPAPYTEADLARTFGPTVQMLDWITQKLDSTYPFPKYYQFAVPGIGGAMENISLVSWDARWVCDPLQHEELGWMLDLVNLHEMAHTWFGDAVVCRDFAHSWLKESWATYMESVWVEDTAGIDEMHVQLARERTAYFAEAASRYVRPIATRHFDSSWDMFDQHLYPGGAVRLHLLRTELGDGAFWTGVRDYLATHRGQVVETDDFRRMMEQHSGRSLARFFDEWFRSPGHPKVKADWSFDSAAKQGRLKLRQTQADPKKGIALFHFDVDVAVEAADGSWSHHTATLDGESTTLHIPLGLHPRQVILDPNSRLPVKFRFKSGSTMARRTLTDCPYVRGRIAAARSLVENGRLKDIVAIRHAWSGEALWGVREFWATALGRSLHPSAPGILADLISEEADPRVLLALFNASARHRSPILAHAIVTWLEAPDRTPRALGAALAALGAQRDPQHYPLLAEAAAAPDGWNGWAQRGAVSGQGKTRDVHWMPALVACLTDPDIPSSTRCAAAEALPKAVSWASPGIQEQARSTLEAALLDEDYAVRMAAGRALGSIGSPRSRSALEALKSRVSVQDRARVERTRASLGGRGGGASRRVEELESKIGELLTRIEKLESR